MAAVVAIIQEAASENPSSLITLGTAGGPSARPGRAQSSNLLAVDGTYYVIDAGDGVARRLARAGIDFRDIGTIFITHHHDDHTAGLGTLMSLSWDPLIELKYSSGWLPSLKRY
jgi:ribonuclease BN (tRNA processing enzyme)